MELFKANQQWTTRPADERFNSLEDLHEAVTRHRQTTREATGVDLKQIKVRAQETAGGSSEPVLIGQANKPVRFTHYSFGQFARRLSAPADYLRTLPAPLAAANLNHAIQASTNTSKENLLLHEDPDSHAWTLRSSLSSDYCRIYDNDVSRRLIDFRNANPQWQPAPAAMDGSRGLYASESDMFVFMVDNNRRVFERDANGGFGRGFFVWNSEVGAASFGVMTFLYQYICRNHIVWGAKGVAEIRIPHIGKADSRAFGRLAIEMRKFSDRAASEDDAKIDKAMRYSLGNSKDEVLDTVFGLKGVNVSRKMLGAAYDIAEQHESWYGSPRTAWGMVAGLTEVARDLPNASDRNRIDREAGKVLQVAF